MKKALLLLPALLTAAAIAPAAHAISSLDLIGIGVLNGNSDLSGLTGTLENGVSQSILGGLGSGLAHAGGTTYLALPDRGPNATPYNSAVDDTTSYIARFHTLEIALSATPNGALPYTVTTTLQKTTLLSSPTPLVYGSGAGVGLGSGAPDLNSLGHYYFSGRSDNFDPTLPSTNPQNGRLDPESIRVSNDGKSLFVSDEYGPYVYQFDRASGQRIRVFNLPANLDAAHLSAVGNTEISGNTSGRTANKGMEGLAITPDGKTLIGFMQDRLIQDASKHLRIVTIDIASGATKEYAYKLTSGSGVSDIVAINDHEFLVVERDGKGLGDGSNAVVKQLFKIDLAGATDVSNIASLSSTTLANSSLVSKSLLLDLVAKLAANGITADQVPAKIEGLAFGEDIIDNGTLFHTLVVANDNDFVPGVAGANKFFVFALSAADLAGYQPQQLTSVPVPAAVWLLGSGLLGMMGLNRRQRG